MNRELEKKNVATIAELRTVAEQWSWGNTVKKVLRDYATETIPSQLL